MISVRPTNGWRVFFGEVGVIVLGVLIALFIGVIADAIRWRVRAGELREAIKGELAINAGVQEERALVQPCLARRLDQIDTLLRAARRSGSLPAIGEIGRPPTRPVTLDSWDLASGSEALLYFDSAEVKQLSAHYDALGMAREQIVAEQENWSTLRAVEQAEGPISDNLLSDLTTVVGRLQFQSYLNGIQAEQGVDFTKRFGVKPSYFILFDKDEPRSEMLASVRERPVCKPLLVNGKPLSA
jgi:hypothetical protein